MTTENLDTAELLKTLAGQLEVRRFVNVEIERLEVAIEQRMRTDHATVVDHPLFEKVKLETTYTYEQAALTPLKELLTDERLLDVWAKAWSETKTIEHPEYWTIGKVRGLLKLGGRVREVIEGARVLTGERLVIKLKPEAVHGRGRNYGNTEKEAGLP